MIKARCRIIIDGKAQHTDALEFAELPRVGEIVELGDVNHTVDRIVWQPVWGTGPDHVLHDGDFQATLYCYIEAGL